VVDGRFARKLSGTAIVQQSGFGRDSRSLDVRLELQQQP
jgi:hypothetical protein